MNKINCSRCATSGFVTSPVVYMGVPGTCYKCDGRGWVYTDKFAEAFYHTPGVYFGLSFQVTRGTMKQLVKAKSLKALKEDMLGDVTITPITVEQARTFFAKYGVDKLVLTKSDCTA